ncbi:MAG TPA: GDSL-type esterase/lipase family protein [Acidimicrobiia bacterium]|jgi:lysophospholipase L1-like esterase|nr:GDSL-type esterase/lipase family protein [Acidimicrobiia bacterium]
MRESSLWRRVGVVSVVLTATAILDAIGPAMARADDDPDRVEVVLLGDSYSAGNGAGDYVSDGSDCHRSWSNWAQRYLAKLRGDGHEVAALDNQACSGDTTDEVLNGVPGERPPQIDAVDDSTDLVLLTIGGNEVGFTPIVLSCFGAHFPELHPIGAALAPFLCKSLISRAAGQASDGTLL